MTSLLDKRLRVDMAILCDMMQKEEIKELKWIPSDKQLPDILTTKSCSLNKFFTSPKQRVI